MSELHPSIVALVALAANIAANHPKQGLCQVARLRDLGVPEAHIRTVVDIARHIRDEAAQTLDGRFDEELAALLEAATTPAAAGEKPRVPKGKPLGIPVAEAGACCTPTPSGQSCC